MAQVKGIDKLVMAEGFNLNNLKAVIKALNGAEILKSAVKTVGIKKEVIVDSFMKAIESIEQGSELEKKIPTDVVKLYNDYVDVIEDKKVGLSSSIVGGTKKRDGEPLVKVKGLRAKNEFGHVVGSQAAKIDEMLIKGTNLNDIVSAIGSTKGRVQSHIHHLRTVKGLTVEVDKDIWIIKG